MGDVFLARPGPTAKGRLTVTTSPHCVDLAISRIMGERPGANVARAARTPKVAAEGFVFPSVTPQSRRIGHSFNQSGVRAGIRVAFRPSLQMSGKERKP